MCNLDFLQLEELNKAIERKEISSILVTTRAFDEIQRRLDQPTPFAIGFCNRFGKKEVESGFDVLVPVKKGKHFQHLANFIVSIN